VLTLVVVIVLVALVFDFINGFHDAANSIATVVSTRVLTPLQAVVWAAFFNFVAAFGFGVNVARTVGKGVVEANVVDQWVILAALVGAIAWDLITWYWGLPTSSSHALIGGFAGAAVAKAGVGSLIAAGLIKIGVFMILAPLLGLVIGFLMMFSTVWTFRRATPGRVDWLFRRAQLVSAAAYSLGHGTNDAQKTMGIIAVLGDHGGARVHQPGHAVRRVAHRQDHGHADHQAAPGRRVLRRDRGGHVADRHRGGRHPGQHHPHDHGRDHGRGLAPALLRRSLGCGRPHHVGVDLHDPGRGDHRRGELADPARTRPDPRIDP
jgi:hypothetical protein